MSTRHLHSLLRLMSRRSHPEHRREATRLVRRGASIIDPAAWDAAWSKAMPADACDFSTHFAKE